MSAHREPTPEPSNGTDDHVATLLRSIGRRPAVPEERMVRVRSAVRAQWIADVALRTRRRQLWIAAALATAATVAVMIGLGGWRPGGPSTATAIVARVETRIGLAWARSASNATDGSPTLAAPGTDLRVGSEIATEEGGRIAIRLTSGHSVRLDERTRARLLTGGAIALERGAVYVDSRGPLAVARGSVDLQTPFGGLRDIGTQFEARLAEDGLVVRVREGLVSWIGAGPPVDVRAGEEMQLAPGRLPVRRDLPAGASVWGWIDPITPLMDVEGRTLREFLDWIARERGLRLEFATSDVASAADRTRLNGSVDGMTLDQALESVLATCRMSHRTTTGALVVSLVDGTAVAF